MLTSQTLYCVIALVIIVFLLAKLHKKIKRPLLVYIMLGVYVLSSVIIEVSQHIWLDVFVSFLLLVLSLTAFLLIERQIIGFKEELYNLKKQKWQEKHPRFFEFQQRHPRLGYTLIYGTLCSYFTYAISIGIMNKYRDSWSSLSLSYWKTDERMARSIILSEGLNWPLKSLVIVILICSVTTLIVVYICSLFVRDKVSFRKAAIPMLIFFLLLLPAPLTLFQRFLVASICAACAYISSKLCFFNLSERTCNLFNQQGKKGIAENGRKR
jgi:hypothetical protein